ncbi:MAG: AAA family ATPase [Polyangiaceae bacterium]
MVETLSQPARSTLPPLPRIPLRYRVPNAPTVFAGRDVELRRLGQRLLTFPFTLLLGAPGMGKTALVSRALHEQSPTRGPAIYVPVAATRPPEDLRIVLGSAFFRMGILDEQTWRSALNDLDAVSAVLLDLTEAYEMCVVIDDAQRAEPGSLREFGHLLLRYASRSRWIALHDDAGFDARLGAETMRLLELTRPELEQILELRAPTLEASARERLVSAAQGSPWRLQQELVAAEEGVALESGSSLGQLAGADRALLLALCRAAVPLTDAQLESMGIDCTEESLSRLEGRGMLERQGDGFRVHELVREELQRSEVCAPDSAFDWQVAAALIDAEDPEAALAALRLMNELGLDARIAGVLDRRGQTWIQRGYGRSLWQLLEGASGAHLERWRLRVALEAASAKELVVLAPPASRAVEDRLLWGRILFRRGQFEEALKDAALVMEELTGAAASAEQREELGFEAALLLAGCYANTAQWARAAEVFRNFPGHDAVSRARRCLLLAKSWTLAGERHAAEIELEALAELLPVLPAELQAETKCALASALYEIGRVSEASKLLNEVDEGPAPALYSEQGRQALFARANIEHARGDLDDCRDILAMLWPFVGSVSMLRPHMSLLDARCRYFLGELDGLDDVLREVSAYGKRVGASNLSCVAENYRLLLAVDCGRAAEAVKRECPVSDPQGLNARMFYLYRLRAQMHVPAGVDDADAAARRVAPDETTVEDILQRVKRAEFPKVGVVSLGVAAEAALLAGRGERALELVDEANELALELDLGVALGSTRAGRCEVLCVLGKRSELALEADRLGEVADRLGSPRSEADAAFFAGIAAGDQPDIALWGRLASQSLVSPATSRRVRALLGARVDLDAYDALVIDAVRRLQRVERIRVVCGEGDVDWQRAWAMRSASLTLTLSDGRPVDLSKRELLGRLLMVLINHGGRASKEQLVLEAWGEREYHPLRHDNRLQAAVRKLRRAIEDNPSKPTRFITTEDGYSLGDPLIWLS